MASSNIFPRNNCGGHVANVNEDTFKNVRETQFRQCGNRWEACRECQQIAIKLGIEN